MTATADGQITLSADAAGTIDLGGGNEITFANIEQIDYVLVAQPPAGIVLIAQSDLIVSEDGDTTFATICFAIT